MTFDDQLKRAFDTLTERLRVEIDRQVQTVVEELAAVARAERDEAATDARLSAERTANAELDNLVAAARQQAHDEGLAAGREAGHRDGHEKGLAAGREAGLQEGHEKGLAAGREAGLREGHEKGLAAGREAGLQEGHEKGLAAGREAGLQEGHEKGLAAGREAGLHEGHEKGLAAGREAGHREGLDEGRRLGMLEGRAQAEQEGRTAIEAALASAAAAAASVPRRTVTWPAEQLADSVRALGRASSLTEILDTLIASVAKEAARAGVWLVRGAALHHWRSAGFDAPDIEVPLAASTPLAEAARSNAAVSGDAGFAVPIAISGEVVAVLYVVNPDAGVPNPDAIDVLTRYAARCLEAMTAFKAARALTDRRDAHGTVAAADDEEDVSARRYARLLVSEIKLYHEAAVVEGRRDRDLASRLGGEIARARVLYEERVPPDVRLRADYFHDELVRTLADGDATLLQLT
jgi:hypothetical protein